MEEEARRSINDACPCPTQEGPLPTQAGPCHIQAGPSHIQAGPSHTQNMNLGLPYCQYPNAEKIENARRQLEEEMRQLEEDRRWLDDEIMRLNEDEVIRLENEDSLSLEEEEFLHLVEEEAMRLNEEAIRLEEEMKRLQEEEASMCLGEEKAGEQPWGSCLTQWGPSSSSGGLTTVGCPPSNQPPDPGFRNDDYFASDNYEGPSSNPVEFCSSHIGAFPNQTGSSSTKEGPSYYQSGHFSTETDSISTQPGPFSSSSGPLPIQTGPLSTQIEPCPTQESSSNTQTGLQTTLFECGHGKNCLKWKCKLMRNFKANHSDSEAEYPCSKRGRTFTRADYLASHSQLFCPSLVGNTGDECTTMDEMSDTHESGAYTISDNVQAGPSNAPSNKPLSLNKGYPCSHCGKTFTNHYIRDNHIRFTCPSITKQSRQGDESTLPVDENIKLQPSPFECKHCKKSFKIKSNLNRHIRTQHEEPAFKCQHCSRHFRKKDRLEEHVQIKHSNNDPGRKLHECPNCGRKYVFKFSLNRHQRYECGVPPSFSCSLCSYTAHQKSSLKKHFRTHGCNE